MAGLIQTGLLLCPLTSHWPRQVTWLSPVLKGGAVTLPAVQGRQLRLRPLLQTNKRQIFSKSSRAVELILTALSLSSLGSRLNPKTRPSEGHRQTAWLQDPDVSTAPARSDGRSSCLCVEAADLPSLQLQLHGLRDLSLLLWGLLLLPGAGGAGFCSTSRS